MGRKRSGSGGSGSPGVFSRKGTGSKTSHTKSSSSSSQQSRPVTTTATQTHQHTGTSHANRPVPIQTGHPQPTATTPQTMSQGKTPGLFTQIAANAASTAIGVTAAHAIMNSMSGLFGGREPTEQDIKQLNEGPCSIQFQSFMKCVEHSNNDVSSCQWAMDMLNQCKNPNASSSQTNYY